MKLQNSTVGESLCPGAKTISGKVATTIALRASEISHSLGAMIVVKRVTTICQQCFFFQTNGDFDLCTP